jgi:transcription initiation factor IIE alpha subunit
VKLGLKGKFITLNTFIKKLEKSYGSNLKRYLITLEQKKRRQQEIIKLKAGINKFRTKRIIQSINKTKHLSFEKNQHDRQTFIQTN